MHEMILIGPQSKISRIAA